METGNQDFVESGRELPKEKCENDILQAGFCDMSFILLTVKAPH